MAAWRLLAPGLLGALLSLPPGCVTPDLPPDLPAARDRGRPSSSARAGPPPAGKGGAPPLSSPRGDLTLEEALSLALFGNPRLQAFSFQVRAAEARRLQAGRLPNPELSLEVEEFGGTGERAAFRSAQTTLALSQVFQLGGKRAKREKTAALERNLAAWDFEEARIDVYARTAKAFVRLLAAQERLAAARQGRDLAGRVRELSSARVRAGKASPLEETKAALQFSVAQVALDRARREEDLARRRLAALWGESRPRFRKARGPFRVLPDSLPPLSALEARLASNPAVARWRDETALGRARLEWARSLRWPDLTVGAGIQRFEEGDDQAFLVQVSLPLMVFNRNQGKIREAEHLLARAAALRKAALVEARAALASAYRTLEETYGSARRFEREILPSAERAFRAAGKGYEEGKFGYLQVLDAQRTLLEARMEYTGILSAFHQARIEIERLTRDSVGKKQ